MVASKVDWLPFASGEKTRLEDEAAACKSLLRRRRQRKGGRKRGGTDAPDDSSDEDDDDNPPKKKKNGEKPRILKRPRPRALEWPRRKRRGGRRK